MHKEWNAKDSGKQMDKRLHIRIDAKTLSKLESLATKYNMSKGQVVRWLINKQK